MADFDLIYPGLRIDDVLETAYELQQQGYIFRGVASEFSGTPTERTWLITGEGSTGYGFTTAVPKGCVGICLFNGSTWSGKVVRVVTIDVAPTSGSTNAVQSGAVYSMVNTVATGISDALNSLTFQETTVPGDEGLKLVESLKMTSQGVTDILTSFTILAATTSKAGLLSASDKAKLDAILTNIRSMVVTDTTLTPNQGTELTESLKWTVGGVQEVISAFTILAATTSKAGLMSAEDKTKLNTLFADGYKFAGIAVPSTVPMSTDAKIFYIATQAGNYASFDNIDLTNGINVLMYSGSAWSSAQLIGIDESPTKGSNNLIKSGGVYNYVRMNSMLTNKGFYIDKNHVFSINRNNQTVYYISTNDWDALLVYVDGLKSIKLNGAIEGHVRYWFFDSANLFSGENVYEHLLTDNLSGNVPAGAVLCTVSLSKEYYLEGYEGNLSIEKHEVTVTQSVEENEATIPSSNAVRNSVMFATRGFYIDYDHVLNIASGTTSITYQKNTNYNCIWIPLNGTEDTLIFSNSNINNFRFFSSYDDISLGTYLGLDRSGKVPDGAAVCIMSLSKELYPSFTNLNLSIVLKTDNMAFEDSQYLSKELIFSELYRMGSSLSSDGKWQSSSTHRVKKVKQGEKYIIRSNNDNDNVRYAFVTTSEIGEAETDLPFITDETIHIVKSKASVLLTVPQDCYLIYNNSSNIVYQSVLYAFRDVFSDTLLPDKSVSRSSVILDTLKDSLREAKMNPIEIITSEDGRTYLGGTQNEIPLDGVISNYGSITSNFELWKYEVTPGGLYRLYGDYTNSPSSGIVMYYWTDTENKILSREHSLKVGEVWDYVSYAPENAKYLYVHKQVAYSTFVTVSNLSLSLKKKNIKLLAIGNSASDDAISYVPFILKNMGVNANVQIGILMQSDSTLAGHCTNFENESAAYYFRFYNGGDTWNQISGQKSIQWALDNYDWDMVSLQHGGNYEGDFNVSRYQPYYNKLVNMISAYVSYPLKFLYYPNHARPGITNGGANWSDSQIQNHYEKTIKAAKLLMEGGEYDGIVYPPSVCEAIVPVSTAIQNARTIEALKVLGDYANNPNNTSGCGYLTPDGIHLQEGLPCQIAAYTFVLTLLRIAGFGEISLNGETTRATEDWTSGRHIPSPHGTAIAATEENCLIAQKCAIIAVKIPYNVTDMNYVINPT